MPRTASKAPAYVTSTTHHLDKPVMDPSRGDVSSTVGRVTFTGPDGERATVHLSLVHRRGRWYARMEHDATDYGSSRTDYREKEIELRFFA